MSRILSNFSVTALGRSKTVHKDEGRFKEKRRFKSGSKGQSGTNTLLKTRNDELCIKNSNCHPEAGPRQPRAFVPIRLGSGRFLLGHRILEEQFTNTPGSLEKGEGLQKLTLL